MITHAAESRAAEPKPAWLVAWHAKHDARTECKRKGNRTGPREPRPPKGKSLLRRAFPWTPQIPLTELGHDIDPMPWADDGSARREPVYNHSFLTPRLVRRVGWVNCLSPYGNDIDPVATARPHRFFSSDVAKVRVCRECKRRVNDEHFRFNPA